jgi:threonine synthase
VTVAALRRLAERGAIPPGETVVVCITGDGLKTVDAAAALVDPVHVRADVDEVDDVLRGVPA